MIKETVTIGEVIELLNDATKRDPEAIARLINIRTLCNESLSNHPTIQVSDEHGRDAVGLLGIINGIFGIDDKGWGGIAALFDVECPKEIQTGIDHGVPAGAKFNDECPKCGSKLVLGALLEFRRVRQ